MLAELRIEFAELRYRQRTAEARRFQQERLYINTHKDDDKYKSDAKCKAKFEDDNIKTMNEFRDLRGQVEMFEEILKAYR